MNLVDIKNLKVFPINRSEYHEWLMYKHYAHRIPSIIKWAFGYYHGSELVGVIIFGQGANNNLNEIAKGYDSCELQRLVIEGPYPASKFISMAIKQLPKPIIIVSYADETMGHHGYIYQATNWLYTGMGSGDVEFEKGGIIYHRKAIFNRLGTGSRSVAEKNGYRSIKVKSKHRYIFLHATRLQRKYIMKNLPYKCLPYPKGNNKRYDASYIPKKQDLLFS